jgi:hypothetical protein
MGKVIPSFSVLSPLVVLLTIPVYLTTLSYKRFLYDTTLSYKRFLYDTTHTENLRLSRLSSQLIDIISDL